MVREAWHWGRYARPKKSDASGEFRPKFDFAGGSRPGLSELGRRDDEVVHRLPRPRPNSGFRRVGPSIVTKRKLAESHGLAVTHANEAYPAREAQPVHILTNLLHVAVGTGEFDNHVGACLDSVHHYLPKNLPRNFPYFYSIIDFICQTA